MWHGAFAVRLGVDKGLTVLLECGLLSTWVEEAFAEPLRRECRAIALGRVGKRNPKHFLFIPAGGIHDNDLDPPPSSELLLDGPLAYLQGDEDSCLRHSMASSLAAMGFAAEAKAVAAKTSLLGCNLALVQETVLLVRALFAKANLGMKKLHAHACSIADVEAEDALWPILLIIQTSDGSHGAHAVTTWNGMLLTPTVAVHCAGLRTPWTGAVGRIPHASVSAAPIGFVPLITAKLSRIRLSLSVCRSLGMDKSPLVVGL
jgi:hypothetical protein